MGAFTGYLQNSAFSLAVVGRFVGFTRIVPRREGLKCGRGEATFDNNEEAVLQGVVSHLFRHYYYSKRTVDDDQ